MMDPESRDGLVTESEPEPRPCPSSARCVFHVPWRLRPADAGRGAGAGERWPGGSPMPGEPVRPTDRLSRTCWLQGRECALASTLAESCMVFLFL